MAKALYGRTVATIVRRANSFRRSHTMGSESTESTHMEVIFKKLGALVFDCNWRKKLEVKWVA